MLKSAKLPAAQNYTDAAAGRGLIRQAAAVSNPYRRGMLQSASGQPVTI